MSFADAASTIGRASWSISPSVKSAGVSFAATRASLSACAFDLYFSIDPLLYPSDSMTSAKWSAWLIRFGKDPFARDGFVFISFSFSWLKVVLMPDHRSGRSRGKDRSTQCGTKRTYAVAAIAGAASARWCSTMTAAARHRPSFRSLPLSVWGITIGSLVERHFIKRPVSR